MFHGFRQLCTYFTIDLPVNSPRRTTKEPIVHFITTFTLNFSNEDSIVGPSFTLSSVSTGKKEEWKRKGKRRKRCDERKRRRGKWHKRDIIGQRLVLTFIPGYFASVVRHPPWIASYKCGLMRLFTTVKIVNYRFDCALTIPKLFHGNIY